MGKETQEEKVMPTYEYLSHADMNRYYMNVCRAMAQAQYRPDAIIALSRGGLDFGVKVSNWFDDVELVPLVWQTRDGGDRDIVKLREVLSKYEGGTILVVDDICDSGVTLDGINTVVDRFTESVNNVIVDYAVALHKESSSFEPTWTGRIILPDEEDTWWVFPWENWWV